MSSNPSHSRASRPSSPPRRLAGSLGNLATVPDARTSPAAGGVSACFYHFDELHTSTAPVSTDIAAAKSASELWKLASNTPRDSLPPRKRPITGETPAPSPPGAGPKSTGMGLKVPRVRRYCRRKGSRNGSVALLLTLRRVCRLLENGRLADPARFGLGRRTDLGLRGYVLSGRGGGQRDPSAAPHRRSPPASATSRALPPPPPGSSPSGEDVAGHMDDDVCTVACD